MSSLWENKVRAELKPYQRDGINWMINREKQNKWGKGGFLCDEMGLGKTLQVIGTMVANKEDRTLVVCPKSVLNQWQNEIEKFAPFISTKIYDGHNGNDCADVDVVIASYSLIPKSVGNFRGLHTYTWDRIVLDEAHEVRNGRSKTHLAIKDLGATITWIVSGTPIFNSINDFIALACLVTKFDKKVKIQQKFEEIRKTIVMRRTIEDVNLEIPECQVKNMELDMYPDELEFYTQVYTEAQRNLGEAIAKSKQLAYQHGQSLIFGALFTQIIRCRQAMSHPNVYYKSFKESCDIRSNKIDILVNMILSHRDENTLVFSQFKEEMNIIEKELKSYGIKTYRIDGSIKQNIRVDNIENFNQSKGGAVFLIQIKAGGQGLNLQNATRIYITSPWWNAPVELQAIGRCHRIGQNKKVFVTRLLYKKQGDIPSMDQCLLGIQDGKMNMTAKSLDDFRILKKLPTHMKSLKMLPTLREFFTS